MKKKYIKPEIEKYTVQLGLTIMSTGTETYTSEPESDPDTPPSENVPDPTTPPIPD